MRRDGQAPRYGFLGTGAIASAIVTGLCDGVADPPAIVVSPRSAAVAADLAARFGNVAVAASNQAVVDGSTVLVVGVRPQDAAAALRGLRIPADRTIISLMAGVSLATLADLAAPAHTIVRAIPLPAVARRQGITPIHPPNPAAAALFGPLGGVIAVAEAASFDAFSGATAAIASYFSYIGTVAAWLAQRGIPPHDASRYVAHMFAGLAPLLSTEQPDFAALADHHATRGGINEFLRTRLDDAGVFAQVHDGLEAVMRRIAELSATARGDR